MSGHHRVASHQHNNNVKALWKIYIRHIPFKHGHPSVTYSPTPINDCIYVSISVGENSGEKTTQSNVGNRRTHPCKHMNTDNPLTSVKLVVTYK